MDTREWEKRIDEDEDLEFPCYLEPLKIEQLKDFIRELLEARTRECAEEVDTCDGDKILDHFGIE